MVAVVVIHDVGDSTDSGAAGADGCGAAGLLFSQLQYKLTYGHTHVMY